MVFPIALAVLLVFQSCSSTSIDDNYTAPRLSAPIYSKNGSPLWFPRIVGGTNAQLGEFRGKVSIQNLAGSHFCGGTLVDPTHVVTAAHCLTTENGAVINASLIQVMGDDLSITANSSPSRQIRRSLLHFVHPNYSVKTLKNDIAVIRLVSPFNATATFHPVNRSPFAPAINKTCTVAGWGTTKENNTYGSPILLRINVNIIDTKVCNVKTSYGGMILSGMFCAGSMAGGRDSCQGDSGGGLMCNDTLAGVVSFGYGCARPNFPGVYTEVSAQNIWINSAITWTGNGGVSPVPTPTTVKPGAASSIMVSVCLILFALGTLLVA